MVGRIRLGLVSGPSIPVAELELDCEPFKGGGDGDLETGDRLSARTVCFELSWTLSGSGVTSSLSGLVEQFREGEVCCWLGCLEDSIAAGSLSSNKGVPSSLGSKETIVQ